MSRPPLHLTFGRAGALGLAVDIAVSVLQADRRAPGVSAADRAGLDRVLRELRELRPYFPAADSAGVPGPLPSSSRLN